MPLSEKETTLLKDLKGQEKLCIEKYRKHASCAKDPQLSELFAQIENIERQHLETLEKMEKGAVMMGNSSSSNSSPKTFTAHYNMAETEDKRNDMYLCSDVLATEKHASSLYNTCVFEFTTENQRNALNHIQKEEQEHGKMIYDYMKVNSMYP